MNDRHDVPGTLARRQSGYSSRITTLPDDEQCLASGQYFTYHPRSASAEIATVGGWQRIAACQGPPSPPQPFVA